MGTVIAVMGVLIGATGYRRSSVLLHGRLDPLSFNESMGIGLVAGVVVFLLYTFRLWPYPDIWGRQD